YVTATAALLNLSEFAAIYWPRVKVLNPAKSVFGAADQIVVAPSGIIAGVYARTDGATPGAWLRPAGGHRPAPHVWRAGLRDRRGARGSQARPRLPEAHQPAHHGPGPAALHRRLAHAQGRQQLPLRGRAARGHLHRAQLEGGPTVRAAQEQ